MTWFWRKSVTMQSSQSFMLIIPAERRLAIDLQLCAACVRQKAITTIFY